MARYGLRTITAPTQEPVTLAELKAHIDCQRDDQDAMLSTMIAAARAKVETDTGRQLVYSTWDMTFDAFPRGPCFYVPRPPLQDIVSILYYDTTGTQVSFGASNYLEHISREPGMVSLAYGSTWPVTQARRDAVSVRFDCGWSPSAVDERAKQAILLLCGHWYENREAVIVGTIQGATALAYESLIVGLGFGDEFMEFGGRDLEQLSCEPVY